MESVALLSALAVSTFAVSDFAVSDFAGDADAAFAAVTPAAVPSLSAASSLPTATGFAGSPVTIWVSSLTSLSSTVTSFALPLSAAAGSCAVPDVPPVPQLVKTMTTHRSITRNTFRFFIFFFPSFAPIFSGYFRIIDFGYLAGILFCGCLLSTQNPGQTRGLPRGRVGLSALFGGNILAI